MDAIDSRNPTNLETKNKWHRKKCRKKYVVQDHHLLKNTRVIILEKLTAREIYSVLNYHQVIHQPPKSISAKFFQRKTSTGRKFFILPRVVTINSFQRSFQYKVLRNILYLNRMLFTFGKIKTPLCLFYHS